MTEQSKEIKTVKGVMVPWIMSVKVKESRGPMRSMVGGGAHLETVEGQNPLSRDTGL